MRSSNRGACRRWHRVFLSGFLTAASLATLAPAAHADQVSCGQVIRTNTTVTNSVAGCSGDGIVIGASGITVDLNGQTIQGVGLGQGLRNDGHDNVTVRNGTIRGFDFGIMLGPGTTRNVITRVTTMETEWSAIHLHDADGNQITHSNVSGFSDVGVRLIAGSSDNLLADNNVGNGNGESFVVEGGSDRNRIERNVTTASSDNAVRVDASAGTMLLGNRISGGSDVAVTMTGSPSSIVQSNTVTMVGDAAILMTQSLNNVVRFNQLGRSADAGIVLSTVSDSLVKANKMSHAGDAGVVLRDNSNGNRVIDNEAHHSSDAGIFIADGVSNVVRGNTLLANSVGIESSGGTGNIIEFNVANSSVGTGIEVSGSTNNTVFGNTTNSNTGGGIWVDEGSLGSKINGNEATGNGGDGLVVGAPGAAVVSNLARGNQGWGIHGATGVVDGGGNGARGNAEAAQCYLIRCSDGSGWVKPVRPPEPLDPLEVGIEGPMKPPKRRRSLRRGKPKPRLAVLSCKRNRRAGRKGRASRRRGAMICRARYRARGGSRRVTGRLIRDDHAYAGGTRKLKHGGPGTLGLRAGKRIRAGRYLLVMSFRDKRGHVTVVRRNVRVR